MHTRLSRDERREQTRVELLDAAVAVFAQRGFWGASVDDVASAAGYTSGAVYSNFGSKEALFLAAFDHEIQKHIGAFGNAVRDASDPIEGLAAWAESWNAFVAERPDVFVLFLEYLCYVIRNPELKPAFGARIAAIRQATADLLTAHAEAIGHSLPLPAKETAIAIGALTNGLAIDVLAGPDQVPDDLYVALLRQTVGLAPR